jgi:hypothetical protein
MGSGSASRIDDPNAAKTYRLEFAYAFVRRESEQNSSLQLLRVCGSRGPTIQFMSSSLDQLLCARPGKKTPLSSGGSVG